MTAKVHTPTLEAARAEMLTVVDELRAALAPSDQGVALQGARAVGIRYNNAGTNRPTTSAGRLVGWSLRETTGAAAAVVILRDGSDAGGAEIAACSLSAGESDREWFGPAGVSFGAGLYVDVVSGSVAGAVYLGAVD